MSFLQGTSSTSDLTTYTFASQNLGAADAKRHIVVCVQSRRASGSPTVNSLSVGGVSATKVVETQHSSTVTSMWIAAVPTGTTGDIVITLDSGMLRCRIQAYALILDSATAHDTVTSTGSNPVTSAADLDIPTGGECIGCAAASYDVGATSFSWSNLTEDSDASIETFFVASSASSTTPATGLTATATPSGSANLTSICGVFASWTLGVGGGGATLSRLMLMGCG